MPQMICPPDILFVVSSYLDLESKRQACLVSQYFHSVFAPIVLRNVHIDFGASPSEFPAIDEHLLTCKSDLPNLYRYASSLRVKTHRSDIRRHVTRGVLPAVWETLLRLRSLRALELDWNLLSKEEDAELVIWYQENIVKSVLGATGGQLDQLVLKPNSRLQVTPPSLEQIRGLKVLRILYGKFKQRIYHSERSDGRPPTPCPPWMKDVIKPLIAANPNLESLEIVQDIKTGGPLPNDVLPASLTCLTSLTIYGLEIPSAPTDGHPLVQVFPLRNLRHLTVGADYNRSAVDVFWEALIIANPPLETFASIHIGSSTMNYLASFSGLRSLEIEIRASPSPDLVPIFLQQVLPCHAKSLERLVINYEPDLYTLPGWDFQPKTWVPALSQLFRLQYLAIYPPMLEDSAADSTKMSTLQLRMSYQTLLDNVVGLPCLNILKINLPRRSLTLGAGYFYKRMLLMQRLDQVVPWLRVRGGKPRELHLDNGEFRCVLLEDPDASETGDADEWGYRSNVQV